MLRPNPGSNYEIALTSTRSVWRRRCKALQRLGAIEDELPGWLADVEAVTRARA